MGAEKIMKLFITFLMPLVFSVISWGHARLTNPTPRNNGDNNKNVDLPCGPGARGIPHTYMPGQTITVQWEETINHTGYYEFFFSPANDQNFTSLKVVQDMQGALVGGQSNKYSTTITFPNVLCNACTLRMIQFMADNPNFPYQSCIDIALTADGNPPPPAGGGGPGTSTGPGSGAPAEPNVPGFGCGAEMKKASNSRASGGLMAHTAGLGLMFLPLFVLAFYRRK
jgi:hypothetical protein